MYSLKKMLSLVRADVSRGCVEKGMAFLPEHFETNLIKVIEKCMEEDKEFPNGLPNPEKKKEIINKIIDKIIQNK